LTLTPRLVLITGPSGAGKSVTAEKVAEGWPGPCALLSHDGIRTNIKSGYAEPAIVWDGEAERQWELAKHIAAAMTRVYLDSGVSVVLEAFATPTDFPGWMQLLGDVRATVIVLLPDIEVTLARNSGRTGIKRLRASDVRQNHAWSAGWADVPEATIIDTGAMDPSEVAGKILQLAAS
jgi:predicted kinase